jgi:N-acyl-D-aspartate/D-glutamate deacylase
MLDIVIRGGTVVDGTGAEAYTADVAVRDGRIVEVGRITEAARDTIDAAGCLVTPGFVDVHTHYDGQVTWDEDLEPSATNGVTTLVMGNCGVGFAPVRPGDEQLLIELMEGVEDIPGSALHEGMPWGAWETFPEYLDYLATRRYSIDVGAQLAHGALRFYAMGERGARDEDATAEELALMGRIVQEAMEAGAVGFSTSRTIGHRSINGAPVPGTFAALSELTAISQAMGRAGRGVFEAIPAGTVGSLPQLGGERAVPADEARMFAQISRAGGRPLTFTTVQIGESPDHWREVMRVVNEENAAGAQLRPQVAARSVTVMTSLSAYHAFMRKPTYLNELAHLPVRERVEMMRRPEIKEALLSEKDVPADQPGSMQNVAPLFIQALPVIFPLSEPLDYEPSMDRSVAARAMAAGVDPVSFMYDLLLEDEGRAFYAILGANFASGTLEPCREMLLDPYSVTGLSDAGAHVNFICDCTIPTFHLTHWVRDRTRGEKLPLELVVHKLTANNAALYGMSDRGRVEAGLRADLNVIDLERLTIHAPFVRADLPAGGTRVLQPSTGYVATIVNGGVVRRDDIDTGARPGRLVRSR